MKLEMELDIVQFVRVDCNLQRKATITIIGFRKIINN